VNAVDVWRCGDCGRVFFPRRELCPHCSGTEHRAVPVERGVAAEVTSHRGVGVACVRVDPDIALLARADGDISPGSEVMLRLEAGAVVARRAALDSTRA
jgi:uncharacterized OB-fold protein